MTLSSCAICEHSFAVSFDARLVDPVGGAATFAQFIDVAGRSCCPLVREQDIDDNGLGSDAEVLV